jgi:hypothetical protein
MKYLKKFYESLDTLSEMSNKDIEDQIEYLSINLKDLQTEIDKLKKILYNRINEVKRPFYRISNDVRYILVFEHRIKAEFGFVGDGIYDLDLDENILRITFEDDVHGLISLNTWNKLKEIMDNYVKDDPFIDYDIDTSRNYLYIYFNHDNHKAELYD